MDDIRRQRKRLTAVAASTVISLACGTNYAYSAWGPQFAEKMQLTNTQSNLIGTAGNVGMYLLGIPLGYVCDNRGPYLNIFFGAFALATGYYPLYWAYKTGPGSMSIWLMCLFGVVTGAGSCSAFQAAIKIAALNWPQNRGTATAFPLAAFGLSAFFFTGVSGLFFPHSTSKFLLFLAVGTSCMVFFSAYFVSVPASAEYEALAASDQRGTRRRRDSSLLQRPSSWGASRSRSHKRDDEPALASHVDSRRDSEEIDSLLSDDSAPGDMASSDVSLKSSMHVHGRELTGLALLPTVDFWILFSILGLLTGIGLMTINNIGHGATALWKHYDPSADKNYVIRRQLMHVSIISITSFCGRLLSGIGSDFLLAQDKPRFFCVVASSSIFALAQMMALTVTNPHFLWIVSALTGIAYGALFGTYPALVADAFGVNGLSMNWGFMTTAPVICGNAFNLIYGSVFDAHSVTGPNGEQTCDQGIDCYRSAYWVTMLASIVSILASLAAVWRDGRKLRHLREIAEGRLD